MSFQQGLSGLNAAAKNLDVIGNNIANVNTVGFKVSTTQFADVYANSLTGSGGLQVGIGTKVAAVAQQFSQGNLSVSNNPLDLAINGAGFFILNDAGANVYSRNGQFHMDKDGYIINSTGLPLRGFNADAAGNILPGVLADLQIGASRFSLAPQVTANIEAVVNLDSREQVPVNPFDYTDPTSYNSSTSSTIYDSLGNAHTYTMYFVKTAANTWDTYATLTQSGTNITYPIDPGTGDVATAPYTPFGNITFDTSGAIDTGVTTMPISGLFLSANLLGTGAADLTFNLDYTGSTQYGSPFSVSGMTQDGYASGDLTGFNIGNDGVILARYSNGQALSVGQVALSNFRNPNGLQALGNNVWAETSDSGLPIPQNGGVPGTSNLGVLQSSSVEDSNIDLTAELVNMITAQRAYQANSQTIKTQDQVMQTLVNLR